MLYLASRISYFFNKWSTIRILESKNVLRNFYQERVKFSLVPISKYLKWKKENYCIIDNAQSVSCAFRVVFSPQVHNAWQLAGIQVTCPMDKIPQYAMFYPFISKLVQDSIQLSWVNKILELLFQRTNWVSTHFSMKYCHLWWIHHTWLISSADIPRAFFIRW